MAGWVYVLIDCGVLTVVWCSLCCVFCSLALQRPVKARVAMTGELSLTGKVVLWSNDCLIHVN